jgi:hypothetical protein
MAALLPVVGGLRGSGAVGLVGLQTVRELGFSTEGRPSWQQARRWGPADSGRAGAHGVAPAR